MKALTYIERCRVAMAEKKIPTVAEAKDASDFIKPSRQRYKGMAIYSI